MIDIEKAVEDYRRFLTENSENYGKFIYKAVFSGNEFPLIETTVGDITVGKHRLELWCPKKYIDGKED